MRKNALYFCILFLPLLGFSQLCNPISTLDCTLIEQQLPIGYDFSNLNGNLSESGFSMVLEPSARLSTDDALATAGVPGYAPSLISQSANGLSITSTKGVFYSQPIGSPSSSDTNSQMNALGVGFVAPTQEFDIKTSLINPDFSISAGNNYQQSGIWFGIDEDHYVKIAVAKTGASTKNIVFEIENLSSSSPFQTINTGNISNASVINLHLKADPINNLIKAYYALDNNPEILIGERALPSIILQGTSYDQGDLNKKLSFSGVYTSHRRASVNEPINVTFIDFSVEETQIIPILSFDKTSLNFFGIENTNIASKSVNLLATTGAPSVVFSDDPDSSSWLILPSTSGVGEVSFGILPNLPVGVYSTTVFAIDQPDLGYANAEITIDLEIIAEGSAPVFEPISINFSRATDTAPAGYTTDSGLGYGDKGNGYSYGWVSAQDGVTPIDISSTARNRNISGVGILENTLVHMQYSSGQEGIWEIEVPNGTYSVTVGVGDPQFDGSQHTINAEGQNVINQFTQVGNTGDPGRFTSGSAIVNVLDGRLTIDASGGLNTKINSITIDNNSPSIVSLNPIDGSTSIPVDAVISTAELVLPNSGIDITSVTTATVQLFEQGSTTPLSVAVNGTESSIEITPIAPLAYNTMYVVDINGVMDLSGELFEAFTSIFTTVGPPSIISLNPIDGSTSVPVDKVIATEELVLNLGIDITSVTTATVQLFEQGSTTPLSVVVNGTESSIEITPTAPLAFNTTYVVDINGIMDLSGELFEAFTSTFTTIDENGSVFEPISINFSRATDTAPAGYTTDSGLGYGDKGNGYSYGWVSAQDGVTPIDISSTARNRNISGVGILENTLLHMQFDDVQSTGQEGIWEIEVPNGTYSVTVGVGDSQYVGSQHTINAEGQNVINQFVPVGVAGGPGMLTSGSAFLYVSDGKLTIDAIGGNNTKINFLEITQISINNSPYFTHVTPANNSVNVAVEGFQINVEIVVPSGYELTASTVAGNVNLYEFDGVNETLVPSNSNDTGGGDAITLTPLNNLNENSTYIFRLTADIQVNKIGDVNDTMSFIPFESQFTTGANTNDPPTNIDLSNIEFIKVSGETELGAGTTNEHFSSLVVGPDGKLYASTIGNFVSDGKIFRWNIEADGTLSNLEILSPNLTGSPHPIDGARENDNRLIIGLAFDPNATAENLVAYVTHSMASITAGPEWDGKLTKLSGPNLESVEDIVIHLPRSLKDHLTNSIAFDTNGDMYISQGSNTAGGEIDPAWGLRPERLLAGAVLKLDLDLLPTNLPLSAYTTDDISVINAAPIASIQMSDGTYNPYATNSPLTTFASGIRNAYDLVWHTNGWLYMPTNGTAGNNTNSPNAPSTANYPLARRIDGLTSIPSAPSLTGGSTQKDWLFKSQGGSYHGHPNPYRGEFVLNHGGMSYSGLPGQSETSYIDNVKYASTVFPDPNYREPAYDFGFNKSPNGVIEYRSDAFGGRLQGLLMVARFSGQDDIMVLKPDVSGDILEAYTTIPGLSGFDDPLDLVEDTNTGNIYVSEYDRGGDGIAKITLLRATGGELPNILAFDTQNMALDALYNGIIEPQQITLQATGDITETEILLTASEDWILVPSTFNLGSPFEIVFNTSNLALGNYSATLIASATNYQEAVVTINLQITNEVVYSYEFNFQDPSNIANSPAGYIDDIGAPYGIQSTDQGDITFGWVLPDTNTPAEAGFNGRNRGGNPLLGTLNIIGHVNSAIYPLRDWLINVPNGTYQVNVSVGDTTASDSHHILDVNGTTIINYNQENAVNGPVNFENTEFIEVVNERLRLSLGDGGSNVKLNYIRFAPINENFVPPIVTANFEGNLSSPNSYRGDVEVTLSANDRNESGITSLEYVLDGAASLAYTAPFSISELGTHNLQVTAVDGNGNTTVETYNFTVEAGSVAILVIENMTKVPGTNRGFPAEDYFSFYRIGSDLNTDVHDTNTMRLNNVGTTNLLVTEINLSNTNDYRFELLDNLGESMVLPLTIPPGTFADVVLTFQREGIAFNTYIESVEIVSNADNVIENTAILHGAFQEFMEGNNEIHAQQVFDVFGFQSSMLSIVNDAGTINPPNNITYRPSSNFPLEENINLGYEGDMILADAFVQADPSKPVIGMQIAALHGQTSYGAKLVQVNGTGTVAGMEFFHNSSWYQTILPRSGSNINFDMATTISEPFRIAVANYLNTGGNNINGNRPDLLGLRVYKVIDYKGNVVPNEYIVIQDFIGSGCAAGSGNCDWQDNVFYFINIKPEREPSAPANSQIYLVAGQPFNLTLENYIDIGYAGNKLEYSVTYNGGSQLPNWMFFNKNAPQLTGFTEIIDIGSYDVLIDGVDSNGLQVSTTLTINVVENLPSDLPWVEDFEDISNGATNDIGDSAWTTQSSGNIFSVQNNRFIVNGSTLSGVWTSEIINFEGAADISVDVDDLDGGEKEDNDFIKAYYSMDGGTPVLFGEAINDIIPQTFNVSGLVGSNLQIIIEAQVSWIDEYFVFDNISVTQSLTSTSKNSIKTKAITSNEGLEGFVLYPNPTKGFVNITAKGDMNQIGQIAIYDITGRNVRMLDASNIQKKGSTYSMDLSRLSSGVYMVHIYDSNGKVIADSKLVIAK